VAAGGRTPVYASRACQQRAYRHRQAAAHVTPAPAADPPSVAALIRDIHELAAVLDAGGTAPADLTAAVRAGTRDLLARTAPAAATSRSGLRLVPEDVTPPAPPETPVAAPPTPAPSRDSEDMSEPRTGRSGPSRD
jgi:hypothetical protein